MSRFYSETEERWIGTSNPLDEEEREALDPSEDDGGYSKGES